MRNPKNLLVGAKRTQKRSTSETEDYNEFPRLCNCGSIINEYKAEIDERNLISHLWLVVKLHASEKDIVTNMEIEPPTARVYLSAVNTFCKFSKSIWPLQELRSRASDEADPLKIPSAN